MSKIRTTVPEAALPEAALVIGQYRYYTVAQICAVVGCEEWVLKEKIRDPAEPLHGQKLGASYIIDEQEFREWVRSGKFSYTHRWRAKSTSE